jgi:hypothetical protein
MHQSHTTREPKERVLGGWTRFTVVPSSKVKGRRSVRLWYAGVGTKHQQRLGAIGKPPCLCVRACVRAPVTSTSGFS